MSVACKIQLIICYIQSKQQWGVIEIKTWQFLRILHNFKQVLIKLNQIVPLVHEIKVQIIKNAKLHRLQIHAHPLCDILNATPCMCVCLRVFGCELSENLIEKQECNQSRSEMRFAAFSRYIRLFFTR